jgi:hypothetical protein
MMAFNAACETWESRFTLNKSPRRVNGSPFDSRAIKNAEKGRAKGNEKGNQATGSSQFHWSYPDRVFAPKAHPQPTELQRFSS